MNLIRFKRMLFKPFFESKIKRQVETTFKLRDILDVVRKREEFRLKLFEVQKIKVEESIVKYQNYIEVLDWVIKNE